jgi:hypothetical protein
VFSALFAAGCVAPNPEAAPANADDAFAAANAWVTVFDPDRAAPGVNLDLYQRRLPILFDNNGRVLHSWPEARVKSRVRLLPNGGLLGLGLGPSVFEYSWEGELTWSYKFEDELPHHDVIRLSNGNTLAITQRDGTNSDDLVEIDRDGAEVWRWRSQEFLTDLIASVDRQADGNLTHLNSVQELPPNRWFEGGDRRFTPGNLLVSARNLDHIFVIDRATGAVVWDFGDRLDMQHEALMVPRAQPGAGAILVLSNGTRERYNGRQSAVLAIEPPSRKVLWEYTDEAFYTNTGGVQQPLANGNVLITSTRGGRSFEITSHGDIVWEWVPPFDPTRVQRYPVSWAPQLRSLTRTDPQPVRPETGYRFVERRTYRFAHRRDIQQRSVAGELRRALRPARLCGQLLLPMAPQLELGFGLGPATDPQPGTASTTRFRATVQQGEAMPVVVLDELLDDPTVWRSVALDLNPFALQTVILCVDAADAEPNSQLHPDRRRHKGIWAVPSVTSRRAIGGLVPLVDPGEDPVPQETDDLSPEEREALRRHLRTMGYVD